MCLAHPGDEPTLQQTRLSKSDVASHASHPCNCILLSGGMIQRLNCEAFESGGKVRLEDKMFSLIFSFVQNLMW